MEESHWVDETTLEVRLRKGLRYQGGEEFSAESFRWAFEEVQRVVLEAHRDHWNRDAEGARLTTAGPAGPQPGRRPDRLVEEVFAGHAHPLAGLTPLRGRGAVGPAPPTGTTPTRP